MSELAPNEPAVAEPESFAFDAYANEQIDVIMRRYPPERRPSAVIPVLFLVQNQMFRLTGSGWIPKVAMDVVAVLLDMAPIRVYEVGTFYSMFNLKPVGRYNLQVCTTTPCWLRGSDDVVAACFKAAGIAHWGGTSADGLFTMTEVECLGACSNAPMIQVNDDYYEDLDGPRTEALLEALRRGETPTPGSTIGRQGSMAESGATTLTDTAALWSPEKYATLKRERAETEARAAAAAAANPPPAEPATPNASQRRG
jgi:NADH-quinone oxidoreductase subunit E